MNDEKNDVQADSGVPKLAFGEGPDERGFEPTGEGRPLQQSKPPGLFFVSPNLLKDVDFYPAS